MSITSISDYRAAALQQLLYSKSATSWGGANRYYSNLRIGGSPGDAGAPANNTAGTVPTGGSTGFPSIADTGGDMFITAIEASLPSPSSAFGGYRYIIADLLWYAGSYTGSSNVTLASQPSFISRVPNGDYRGTQLWTIGTGGAGVNTPELTITYTNESGTTGRSSGLHNFNRAGSSNVGLQAHQVALQDGDQGVQKVESVVGNGSTTYQCNVVIVRPLVAGRVTWGTPLRRVWLDGVGMPQVFPTSALVTFVSQDGSSPLTTVPIELSIELASKLYTGTSGVTWNPSDKGAGCTLSNGNLTAADGGVGDVSVRATVSRSSGKYYWEVVGDVLSTSSNPYAGIKPISASRSAAGPFSGGGDFGIFMRSPNDGIQTYQPGSTSSAQGPAHVDGDVFMFAADINNRKFYAGKNGVWAGGWNPSTGSGGLTLTAGETWAAWCVVDLSTQLTARFEVASWSYTCPSGFEPWH